MSECGSVTNKPIVVLSLGAGVQSTTLLLMAEHGEIARPMEAIFADTDWEPATVYDHLAWLKGQTTMPIRAVSAGNLREAALAGNPKAWMPLYLYNRDGRPGMLRRQCIRHFKLDPIRRRIRALCAEVGGKLVTQQIGISLEEAAHQMRSSDVHYITNVYPLVDLRVTRWDCRNWRVRRGYPLPAKSSCIGCPYRSDWGAMKRERPEEWLDAVAFDEAIRTTKGPRTEDKTYLHPLRRPLVEVDLTTPQERGQLSFLDECEGMCGV